MKNDPVNIANPETMRAVEEYLVETGRKIEKAVQQPIVQEINGLTHVFFGGTRQIVEKEDERELPHPETFETFSLQGLVDYINNDPDQLFESGENDYILRVTNEKLVELLSPITGYKRKRYVLARCCAMVPQIRFGQYMDIEDFQVMLQSKFLENDNRNTVLLVSGNLSENQTMQKADDGVSQRVTIQQGVSSAATVTVKNPVSLIPFRTFNEIEQPSSSFVLRFNKNSECALFEGDGGLWKIIAVNRIAKWLEEKIDDHRNVQVIA